MSEPLSEHLERLVVDHLCDFHEQRISPDLQPDSNPLPSEAITEELQQSMAAWRRTIDVLHLAARETNSGCELERANSADDRSQALRRIDRFELTGAPLAGGFGLVFPALDPCVQRRVAIKVPKPEFLDDRSQIERFTREACACSRLDHGNILPILESHFDGIMPFIVMPWVTGPTLAFWRRSVADLKPETVADIVRQLAEGVAHAHERGVLHRDIKPGNILLAPADPNSCSPDFPFVPQLADFGLARFEDADSQSTTAGTILGTVGYMAPEQRRGQRELIGPASDIYSLGAVLYFLLATTPPPDGTIAPPMVAAAPRRISQIELPPLTLFSSGRSGIRVPADLSVICQKCLATSPVDRYLTARALADDLQRFLNGQPILARPAPLLRRVHQWVRKYPAWTAFGGVTAFSSLLILAMSIRHSAALTEQLIISENFRNDLAVQERLMRQRAYSADMSVAWRAWNRGEVGRTLPILERYRNPAGNEDVRDFSWWLLWREYTENSRVIGHHSGGVTAAAMTHDGTMALTGGRDGIIRCWSLPEGTLTTELVLNKRMPVRALQLSPDESHFLSAGEDGLLRFWDASTFREIRSITGHSGPILAAAFSPDGQRVATGGKDQIIRLWDAASGAPAGELKGHTDVVTALAFHPQQQLLISGGRDQSVRLWDLTTFTPDSRIDQGLLPTTHQEGSVLALAVAPDGQRLLAATNHVRLLQWSLADAEFGQRVTLNEGFPELRENARTLIWPRDWMPVWAGTSIHSGDPTSGRYPEEYRGHLDSVMCLAASDRRDSLVSGSADGEVRFWPHRQVSSRLEIPLPVDEPFPWRFTGMWYTDLSDKFCLSTNESRLVLFNTTTGEVIRNSRWRVAYDKLQLAPDNQTFLAWNIGRSLTSMDLTNLTCRWEKTFERQIANQGFYFTFSRDSKYIAVSELNEVLILDNKTGDCVRTFSHPAPATESAFFEGEHGETLVISGCQDGRIRIWDLKDGRLQIDTAGHGGVICSLATSPDQKKLVTSGYDRVVRIWSLPDLQELSSINFNTSRVRFFSGTEYLVCEGSETVVLRVSDQSERISVPWSHSSGGVAVSPDGTTLGLQLNHRIRLIRDEEPASRPAQN